MQRIEICGGIGIGKSTFATRLSNHLKDFECIEEKFDVNPIWKMFYSKPVTYIKEKNIIFLAQHCADIKTSVKRNSILDFSPFQDLAYAKISNIPGHFEIMKEVYKHLFKDIAPAYALIHLKSDPSKQMRQVESRGREEEKNIDINFLIQLNTAIDELAGEYSCFAKKYIVLNTDSIDLRTESNAIEMICSIIRQK